MLPSECKRLLQCAECARCFTGVIIRGDELFHQSPLLCDALFNFDDMPPCGSSYKLVHAVTPRHRMLWLGI